MQPMLGKGCIQNIQPMLGGVYTEYSANAGGWGVYRISSQCWGVYTEYPDNAGGGGVYRIFSQCWGRGYIQNIQSMLGEGVYTEYPDNAGGGGVLPYEYDGDYSCHQNSKLVREGGLSSINNSVNIILQIEISPSQRFNRNGKYIAFPQIFKVGAVMEKVRKACVLD